MDCGPRVLFFFLCMAMWLLDELDVPHCQELLDHRIGSEHNLSLLYLHRCPAVGRSQPGGLVIVDVDTYSGSRTGGHSSRACTKTARDLSGSETAKTRMRPAMAGD
jgi:hypothetical protein